MDKKDLQKYLMAQGISEARSKKILPRILELSHDLHEAEIDQKLNESATIGTYVEARIHLEFTEMADMMYSDGRVTRDERKILSSAIGAALDAFINELQTNAPQLYQRSPWEDASDAIQGDAMAESAAAPVNDAVELMESAQGMYMPLVEKAVRLDGTIPLKIIQPGWGSSGYYPKEVLQRDGPNIFTPGVKMYWNHQTVTEEAERPEGDLNALAAELVSAAKFLDRGPAGPGLYADAKVFEAYQKPVDDLAEHIYVSIRAYGKAQKGLADGKEGPIITELTSARSVDFVTEAGAGGQILTLFESARHHPAVQKTTSESVEIPNSLEEARMDELQKPQETNATLQTKLSEAEVRAARAQEALAIVEAKGKVQAQLAKLELPEATKNRLVESLSKAAPIKDGALDQETFGKQITEAIKAEVDYLTQVAGLGTIRGLGEAATGKETESQVNAEESLAKSFEDLGLNESRAKIAAQGRA